MVQLSAYVAVYCTRLLLNNFHGTPTMAELWFRLRYNYHGLPQLPQFIYHGCTMVVVPCFSQQHMRTLWHYRKRGQLYRCETTMVQLRSVLSRYFCSEKIKDVITLKHGTTMLKQWYDGTTMTMTAGSRNYHNGLFGLILLINNISF